MKDQSPIGFFMQGFRFGQAVGFRAITPIPLVIDLGPADRFGKTGPGGRVRHRDQILISFIPGRKLGREMFHFAPPDPGLDRKIPFADRLVVNRITISVGPGLNLRHPLDQRVGPGPIVTLPGIVRVAAHHGHRKIGRCRRIGQSLPVLLALIISQFLFFSRDRRSRNGSLGCKAPRFFFKIGAIRLKLQLEAP